MTALQVVVLVAVTLIAIGVGVVNFVRSGRSDLERAQARFKQDAEDLNQGRRPQDGPCPACGAAEDQWCRPGCRLIDPKDNRL